MLNKIVIMGRLTRDPELRRTASGAAVTSFTVACDRDYAPEGQERGTDFIDCVAWRATGEFVSKYFTKGSMIVVAGRLQLRDWTDKDGNKRRSAEIVAYNCYFGESKKQDQGGQNGFQGYQQGTLSQPTNPPFAAPQSYGAPQYSQQGFGGYQQGGYNAPGYQAPPGAYARIDADDQNLHF